MPIRQMEEIEMTNEIKENEKVLTNIPKNGVYSCHTCHYGHVERNRTECHEGCNGVCPDWKNYRRYEKK
jgi:hypothetical protein